VVYSTTGEPLAWHPEIPPRVTRTHVRKVGANAMFDRIGADTRSRKILSQTLRCINQAACKVLVNKINFFIGEGQSMVLASRTLSFSFLNSSITC
jgi:hypothetical protein